MFWRKREKPRRWHGPFWAENMWSEPALAIVGPITRTQLKWPNWFQRMGRRMIEIFKPNISWTPQEALYCLLAAAAWADGKLQSEEEAEIKALANRSPTLSNASGGDLKSLNDRVVRRLNGNFEAAVERACASLPDEMKRAAFSHAVDIVYADRAVLPEEARFLNKLVELLAIPEEDARETARVLEAKNAY